MMEHVDLSTPNILDENVEKLAELFPEVVTEVREPDGTLRHTIDVDALKECVGDVAEGQRERYQFTWPGKREAKQEAYRQIDKCLRPCPEESVDWDTTQNLYIEGDNLDALKLLRNTYAGKVKMIYIDPPYNTGHDFIYDDDFARTKADYDADSGDYDEEGGRLVANPESNGRFHSDWCSMMYPRLLLARDLLSEDGAIVISIDSGEYDELKRICDEVFGRKSFVAPLIWNTKNASKGVPPINMITSIHEYVLVYARNINLFAFLGVERTTEDFANPDNDPRGLWRKEALVSTVSQRTFEITDPVTGWKFNRAWAFSPETINKMISEGRVLFPSKPDGTPLQKKFFNDYTHDEKPLVTQIGTFQSRKATSDLMRLFDGKKCFDYPKPIELMTFLIEQVLQDSGILLDFFSGSATTAHAVMKLNAEDGGSRRFIMVQLPEACDEKSEAAKAGYKNICEIGKERIRRAGKKIVAEIEKSNRQLKLGEEPERVPDVGFRVLKIDSSNFRDVSAQPSEFMQDKLMGMADNLKPDRSAEDLLFQVMPQFQIPLSASIEKFDVQGFRVFSVDGGRLISCFDGGITTDAIAAMAKLEPDYAVMRDASFIGDDAVANFGELFKTYSPVTITKVI